MLGQLWCDGAADWDALASLQTWGTAFRQLTRQAGGLDMEQTVQLRRTLAQLLTEGRALVQPEGQIGRALAHYCQAFEQFNEAKQRLETLLHSRQRQPGARPTTPTPWRGCASVWETGARPVWPAELVLLACQPR